WPRVAWRWNLFRRINYQVHQFPRMHLQTGRQAHEHWQAALHCRAKSAKAHGGRDQFHLDAYLKNLGGGHLPVRPAGVNLDRVTRFGLEWKRLAQITEDVLRASCGESDDGLTRQYALAVSVIDLLNDAVHLRLQRFGAQLGF